MSPLLLNAPADGACAAVHHRDLCGCVDCLRRLRWAAHADPRLEVLVITERDRIVMTADHLLRSVAGAGLQWLLDEHGDCVRSLSIRAGRHLVPPEQSASLAVAEDRCVRSRHGSGVGQGDDDRPTARRAIR